MKKIFLISTVAIFISLVAIFSYPFFLSDSNIVLAATPICTDSDSGQTYYTKGSVQTCDEDEICTDPIYDSCSGSTLIEYYCDGTTSQTINHTCPGGCQDGLCLPASLTCTDSDSGQTYYTKGSVKTCDAEEACTDFIYDYCSSTTLTEYYCDGTTSSTATYTCLNGCQNSRCLRGRDCFSDLDCEASEFCELATCGASQGECVSYSGSCADIYDPTCGCNGTTYSNSCYRRNAQIDQDYLGRCGDACTDSDDGRTDYHTKGTVAGYNSQGTSLNKTDSCSGDDLTEYYCDSQELVASSEYTCPNGCSGGVCVIDSTTPPEPEVIVGCMDSFANNYNADATQSDTSCTYTYGCMNSTAENYNADATRTDGSCIYPDVETEPPETEPEPDSTPLPEPDEPSQESDSEPDQTPAENKLLERIRHLEYQISELERSVVTLEKRLFTAIDNSLTRRLKGRILLQVEENGEAWYVDEDTEKKFYLKDGNSAYIALNAFGLGISNANIAQIPIGIEERAEIVDTDGDGLDDKLEEALGTDINNPDTDGDGYSDGDEVKSGFSPLGLNAIIFNSQLSEDLKGKILLQVESRGEAWYVNPVDGKRYYMKDGEQAYQIMRFLSLGVTNIDLRKIAVGEFE